MAGLSAESYEKLDDITHVLERPHNYIGPMIPETRSDYIIDLANLSQGIKLLYTQRQMCVPPLHIFVELLSNGGDNADRSWREGIDPGSIDVKANHELISVTTYGQPIVVAINEKHKQWIPDMIFGNTKSGSNFQKAVIRFGNGQNGLGAKLTNIFSRLFQVDIVDNVRKLRYQQTWTSNMRQRGEPVITPCPDAQRSSVTVTYAADFNYFKAYGMTHYDQPWLGLMARYVADMSLACKVPCSFNGISLDCRDIRTYAGYLFSNELIATAIYHAEAFPATMVERCNYAPMMEIMVLDTPDEARVLSFVNGIMTLSGGTHVDEVLKASTAAILEDLNKNVSVAGSKLTIKDVRDHLSLILVCRFPNPTFDSQTKRRYVGPVPPLTLPANIIQKVKKWQLVGRLLQIKESRVLKKVNKGDGKRIRHDGRPEHANLAGKKNHALQCMAYCVEGDSAMTNVVDSLAHMKLENPRNYVGIFPFRGKIPNVSNSSLDQIFNNREFSSFRDFMGLKEGMKNFEELAQHLKYGWIVMKFDPDDDGTHIRALFLNWMRMRFPHFLRAGRVLMERTPVLSVSKGSRYIPFFSRRDYDTWLLTDEAKNGGWHHKYNKGLGTIGAAETKAFAPFTRQVFLIVDDTCDQECDVWFDSKQSDMRKKRITDWTCKFDIESLPKLPISMFLNEEFILYARTNVLRSIPHVMDGLKRSQRQILWTAIMKIWKTYTKGFKEHGSKTAMKVIRLANAVAEFVKYEHGENSLAEAIFNMSANFVGSNNLPDFDQDGAFGTRKMGGKDHAAPRYPNVIAAKHLAYIYHVDDMPLLKHVVDEDEKLEPYFLLPIVPRWAFNGVNGIGSGWSTTSPPMRPSECVKWFILRNQMEIERKNGVFESKIQLPFMIPWWRGFKGTMTISKIKSHQATEDEILPSEHAFGAEEANEESEEIGEVKSANEVKEVKEAKYVDHFANGLKPKGMEISPSDMTGCRLKVVTRGVKNWLSSSSLEITELPPGRWTKPYMAYLEKLYDEGKIGKVSLTSSDTVNIGILITGIKESLTDDQLQLCKSHTFTNMTFLTRNAISGGAGPGVNTFPNMVDMMEYFFKIRLEYYQKRKDHLVSELQTEIEDLRTKARFLILYREGKIVIRDREMTEIHRQMDEHKLPYKLIDMPLKSESKNDVTALMVKANKLEEKIGYLKKRDPCDMWIEDLSELMSVLPPE